MLRVRTPRRSYLDETLADVAGAEGFVAAGGQRQAGQEEEERCGSCGGRDHLTGPHPDGTGNTYVNTGQDLREQTTNTSVPEEGESCSTRHKHEPLNM